MIRALFLTPLLIVALLVCPLRCWGTLGGDGGTSDRAAAHCGCCPGNTDDACPDDDAPRDDCGCQDCLCDGAVLDTGVIVLDFAHAALLDAPRPADDLAGGMGNGWDRADDGPPFCVTGHSVRILHQSFVI